MAMNWKEPETRSKFLLAILACNDDSVLSGSKAAPIAQYMGCTAKAVTHQLSSLKKDVEALKQGDFTAASSSAPATPKSTGNRATTPRKRKTKDANAEEGDEPGSPSPTKKTKGAAKKKGAAVKKSDEKVDEDESGGDEADNGEKGENGNGEHDI